MQNVKESSVTDDQHHFSFAREFTKKAVVYSGGIALVSLYGVPALFSMLGFGAGGPIGYSLATAWQATGYLPGAFSFVQSAAATNIVGVTMAKIGAGVGATKAYHDTQKAKRNQMKDDKRSRLQSKL